MRTFSVVITDVEN